LLNTKGREIKKCLVLRIFREPLDVISELAASKV
jgi:hypothetical protein